MTTRLRRAMLAAVLLISCNVGRGTPSHSAVAAAASTQPSSTTSPASASSAPVTAPSEGDTSAKTSPPETPAPRYPFHEPLPGPELVAKAPASRYANFSPAQCHAEVKKRDIAVKATGPARGIATPLRIAGPLHGVRFVTPGSKSVYGMLDCRLVLALDDLAAVLDRDDVAEVQVDNLYRPRAHLPGKKNKRSQHAYGLAVDIFAVKLRDGRTLVVEHDWHGAIGAPPCGPDSTVADAADETIRLRNLLCDVAREGVFHHLLTPNYDTAHSNHLHLDIKRDEHSIVVR